MWEDPIVEETRKLRQEYAEQLNNDSDAIFNDICNRQKKKGKKCVSFPSKKPIRHQKVA
jgi:hypothetical protein